LPLCLFFHTTQSLPHSSSFITIAILHLNKSADGWIWRLFGLLFHFPSISPLLLIDDRWFNFVEIYVSSIKWWSDLHFNPNLNRQSRQNSKWIVFDFDPPFFGFPEVFFSISRFLLIDDQWFNCVLIISSSTKWWNNLNPRSGRNWNWMCLNRPTNQWINWLIWWLMNDLSFRWKDSCECKVSCICEAGRNARRNHPVIARGNQIKSRVAYCSRETRVWSSNSKEIDCQTARARLRFSG
jgi:hypothetical protein